MRRDAFNHLPDIDDAERQRREDLDCAARGLHLLGRAAEDAHGDWHLADLHARRDELESRIAHQNDPNARTTTTRTNDDGSPTAW